MGRSSPRTAMTICHVLQALLPMELTIDASPPQIRVGSTGSGTTMSLPDMGPFDLRHTASQSSASVPDCEDPFDYVGSSASRRHSSSKRGLRSDKDCPGLMEFLCSGVTFASVDISNDRLKMRHSFGIEIPAGCLVHIQTIFKLQHDRTSMARMAVALIDDSYADMKTSFPRSQHRLWEKGPLDDINIEYAAKDAYVSYELYRRIRLVNYGQRHIYPLEEGGHSDLDDSDE